MHVRAVPVFRQRHGERETEVFDSFEMNSLVPVDINLIFFPTTQVGIPGTRTFPPCPLFFFDSAIFEFFILALRGVILQYTHIASGILILNGVDHPSKVTPNNVAPEGTNLATKYWILFSEAKGTMTYVPSPGRGGRARRFSDTFTSRVGGGHCFWGGGWDVSQHTPPPCHCCGPLSPFEPHASFDDSNLFTQTNLFLHWGALPCGERALGPAAAPQGWIVAID